MKNYRFDQLFVKGALALSFLFAFSFASASSNGGGDEDRAIVVRVVSGFNLELRKGQEAGVIGFNCLEGDMVRISALKVGKFLKNAEEMKENVRVYLRSEGNTVELHRGDLDTWIEVPGNGTRVELVVERGDKGVKVLEAGDVRIWRKTMPEQDQTFSPGLEVSNLYFAKLLFP